MRTPPTNASDSDLQEVFTTADSSLLPVIRSVLRSAGIPFLVQGEEAQALLPMPSQLISRAKTGLGARLMVPRDRAGEALAVLGAFTTEAPADTDSDSDTDTDTDPE